MSAPNRRRDSTTSLSGAFGARPQALSAPSAPAPDRKRSAGVQDVPPPARSDKGPGKIYRWLRRFALVVVLLAVVTLAVIFGIDNQTPMTVHFLDRASPEWPASWWLGAAFGCGLLLGMALCAASLVRSRFNQRRLRRYVHQREPSAGE